MTRVMLPSLRAAIGCALWLAGAGLAAAESPRRITTSVTAAALQANMRSPQALYVTATEAEAAVKADASILLVDVRTQGELTFDGAAPPMTRNIPYLMLDEANEFDPDRQGYRLVANPEFPQAVDKLVAERGGSRDSTIILLCTTGERSAKAASYLASVGYTAVYTMVDGLSGEAQTAKGTAHGWRGSGLPWTFKLRKDQLYQSPSM